MDNVELKKKFFKQGDNFDVSELSDAEYQYYVSHLLTQRRISTPVTVLYFDRQWYNIVKGYQTQNYNGQNGVISQQYKVEVFDRISVKDNLLIKLEKPFKLIPKQLIITNINTASILARKIALQGDYDLLCKSLPVDIEKCYEDLIGSIESQGDFFQDDTFFREQIKIIHQSEKMAFPHTITALILWFSSFK